MIDQRFMDLMAQEMIEDLELNQQDVQLASANTGVTTDGYQPPLYRLNMPKGLNTKQNMNKQSILLANSVAGGGKGGVQGFGGIGGDLETVGRMALNVLGFDVSEDAALITSEDIAKKLESLGVSQENISALIDKAMPNQAGSATAEEKAAVFGGGETLGEVIAPGGQVKLISAVAKPVIKATKEIAKVGKDLPVSTSIDLVDGAKQPLEKISKVESKAFKNWFGESKAVDDVGKPVVVYHARRGDFEAFDASKSEGKSGDTGTFFSSSPSVAATYNTSSEHSLVPAYLSLKKPFIVDFQGSNWNRGGSQAVVKLPDGTDDDLLSYFNAASDEFVSTDDVARYAKINGYDGVIIQNVVDHGPAGRFSTEEAFNPSNIYVSFAPTQIKSAISNKGTFDINDPDYLKGIGVGGTSATMYQEEDK